MVLNISSYYFYLKSCGLPHEQGWYVEHWDGLQRPRFHRLRQQLLLLSEIQERESYRTRSIGSHVPSVSILSAFTPLLPFCKKFDEIWIRTLDQNSMIKTSDVKHFTAMSRISIANEWQVPASIQAPNTHDRGWKGRGAILNVLFPLPLNY